MDDLGTLIPSAIFGLDLVVMVVFIPWALATKKEASAAVAWCLVIILVPLVGAFLFWVFGHSHVNRPLKRVRTHRRAFRATHPPPTGRATRGEEEEDSDTPTWCDLGAVASRVQAFPVSPGNAVALYHDTSDAFAALLDAILSARHHIHLEFFIYRSDATTDALIGTLARRARMGVEVRLLYDAMGSVGLRARTLRPLEEAGGMAHAFLPLNPWRSRIQVNLRNHRKLAVVDGRIAFTGGMNIGDEYLGKDEGFGYWRDSFLRLSGPAVAGFQRVFAEDWDFAVKEPLNGDVYYPPLPAAGDDVVQVIESGPDQEIKSIREVLFAALSCARERVWIASPYFVPDAGLRDALRLARYRGVEVRLLTVLRPDHWLAYLAARYHFAEALDAGVEIYQYKKGMMHAKVVVVDGRWGMVGSANFDNRSLHLSFESGLILHTPARVAELDAQYRSDMENAIRLDPERFASRPYLPRLLENACRLLDPLL